MGYSKDIYEAANRKLSLIRQENEAKSQQRREIFFMKYPRSGEIEKLLSSTAIKVAKSVLRGANTKEQLTYLKEQNLKLQDELHQILKSQGLSDDYLDIKYSCKKCKDTGYIDGKMCTCLKKLLKQEAYNKVNSLSPLSLSTFDTFSLEYYPDTPIKEGYPSSYKRMCDIFNYVKRYAETFDKNSKSLLLQGATGLGKTHLSLAIANEVLNKGYGVIYGSVPNILSKLEKERFRYNKAFEQDETEQYLNECDLLILDDLGTEFSTNFSNSMIYNIVNTRIMYSKPTIISTNLSMKELEKAYTERLVSRFMGNNIRLVFLGKDIRQQKILKKRHS